MAVAAPPVPELGKKDQKTVDILGHKVSYDALFIGGASLVGILVLWRIGKPGSPQQPFVNPGAGGYIGSPVPPPSPQPQPPPPGPPNPSVIFAGLVGGAGKPGIPGGFPGPALGGFPVPRGLPPPWPVSGLPPPVPGGKLGPGPAPR